MSAHHVSADGKCSGCACHLGLSARAIAGYGDWHPFDAGDLGRCIAYCKSQYISTSELRKRIKGRSEAWDLLLPEWDNLTRAHHERYVLKHESVDVDRMIQRVLNKGTACQSCGETGRGEPCNKCKGTGRRGGGRCRAYECNNGYTYCRDCGGRGYTTEES